MTKNTVADRAVASVLQLPVAKGNKALPSLISFLAFEAPMIDSLPFMFLRSDTCQVPQDPDLLARVERLAVAGRILVARVRWLDEMLDSRVSFGTPEEVHGLSEAVHKHALDCLVACFTGPNDEMYFLGLMAQLEARYSASLAIDAASCKVPGEAPSSVRVDFTSYAAQARARAILASAPVEAQLIITEASTEERRCARKCLGSLLVAWQLYDDVLDVEEDHRDGRLSWIISETLQGVHDCSYLLETDAFYEAALFGGHVHATLKQSELFYRKAASVADSIFPKVSAFARSEIHKVSQLAADLSAIVSSASRD